MKKMSYIVLAITVVIVLLIIAATRPRPGDSVPSLGNQHLQSIDEQHMAYNTSPPTSGPHLGQKAPWGVSDEQISDELQVHNLEDGGVIVHYDQQKTDEDTLERLTEVVRRYTDKVILEPYANLETPIVLTAWGRIDKLEAYDETRITSFISAYRGIDHHK